VRGTKFRQTLGDWPTVKVEDARKRAATILGEIAAGKDPGTERKRAGLVKLTVRQALDQYIASRKGKLAERTVDTYLDDVAALMGDEMDSPIGDIDRDAFTALYEARSAASPSRANGGARVMRAVFNHLRRTQRDERGIPLLPDNPVDALKDDRAWIKVEGRSDRLYASQLPDWWRAVIAERDDVASYFITLILTGLRRTEAMVTRWEWVNLAEGVITIPAEFTKGKRTHTLPVGEWLKAHLTERKEVCETRESGPWVFPGHVHGRALVNPEKPRKRIVKRSGVMFTPHSLRRTFASIASESSRSTLICTKRRTFPRSCIVARVQSDIPTSRFRLVKR